MFLKVVIIKHEVEALAIFFACGKRGSFSDFSLLAGCNKPAQSCECAHGTTILGYNGYYRASTLHDMFIILTHRCFAPLGLIQ